MLKPSYVVVAMTSYLGVQVGMRACGRMVNYIVAFGLVAGPGELQLSNAKRCGTSFISSLLE